MREEPKIDYSYNPDNQAPWGTGIWFRDFRKRTLNRRGAFAVLGLVFVVVAAVQLSLDNNHGNGSSPTSPVPAPVTVNTSSLIDIPKIAHSDGESSEKPRIHSHPKISGVTYRGPEVISRPRNLAAIPPGTLVRAVLATGAANGAVRADLREPVRVNGEVLIDEGATLVGMGTSTEDRLFVKFTEVVFKDGER